jgi:hypothetical protein
MIAGSSWVEEYCGYVDYEGEGGAVQRRYLAEH